VSVVVKDTKGAGVKALTMRFKEAAAAVLVGVPAGAKEDDEASTPIAMLAAVHEFGAPSRHIPERPFLRPAITEGRPDFIRLNRANMRRVARGRTTIKQALGELGELGKRKVQEKIKAGPFRALRPATIAARKRRSEGSSKPLIDTGNLRQSITWILDDGKAAEGSKVLR